MAWSERAAWRALEPVADGLLASLFAPACVCCHRVLDSPTRSPACDACWMRLRRFTPPLCDRCGIDVPREEARHDCLDRSLAMSSVRAVGPYEDVLRDLIHALKYDERRSLASALAPALTHAARDLLVDADALVPVPLHPWRHWRRGFNQAHDLAAAVARVDDERRLPVWTALRRRRATRPQSNLDADARQANVGGAFTLNGFTARGRRAWSARIENRILILVDDVMTTGATLAACAEVLRGCGARDVRAIALARVALPGRG
jgi:ComF family protein